MKFWDIAVGGMGITCDTFLSSFCSSTALEVIWNSYKIKWLSYNLFYKSSGLKISKTKIDQINETRIIDEFSSRTFPTETDVLGKIKNLVEVVFYWLFHLKRIKTNVFYSSDVAYCFVYASILCRTYFNLAETLLTCHGSSRPSLDA